MYYSEVATVTFESSTLNEVPKRLFDTYPHLKSANLSRCGIKEINRYSLEQSSQLTVLDLSWNKLTELKAFCFTGATMLSQLNLTLNNISVIEEGAFNTLSNLVLLQLSGNKLRKLPSNVFNPLTSLKTIYLNSNQLEVVEQDLFSASTVLENVLLQYNRITVVGEGAFVSDKRPKLKIISLSNNNLTMLDLTGVRVEKLFLSANMLKEISISPWIQHIYASNNKISSIVLTDTSTEMLLTTLGLENNSITSLETIRHFRSLVVLDLANNKIGALNLTSFANLVKLEQLGLERTFISNLQHGTFAQLGALKVLDISDNNLDRFDFEILTSSTNLEQIYIDGNRLKSIDYEHLRKTFPSLAWLGVSNNNWNCSYLIKLVRYCTENSITLYKPSLSVQNQTNVKGIYCYDDKNPLANWNTTLQQIAVHPHLNITSEESALQAMLQSVLDDVRRFSETHANVASQTTNLEGSVYNLTQNQFILQGQLNSLQQSLFEVRLSLLSNRTNGNASSVTNDELRQMIETANNLTLDKQELSAKKLDFKLYEQSFKVEKALEIAKENGDKLTALAKRMEQWIGNIVSGGGALGMLGHDRPQQQQQRQSAQQSAVGSESGHQGYGLVIALVVMLMCLIVGVNIFVIFKISRRPFTIERKRYTHRDSSLTTIVDNDI
uniref:Uncharacterized protein n=1 Tax=Anopheles farauti TaxID=69004 RepID=A0A182QQF5_9DIPT